MTTERQEEAGPVTVQIGVCSVCHALFLISPERETSPCHGADPLAVLATVFIGPDGVVTGEWGFVPPGLERDITEEPALAPAPPQEPPAAEEEEAEEKDLTDDYEVLLSGIGGYLADGGLTDDDVAGWLERMGAEPEAAATAVGRLSAVRELLQELQLAREPTPVAPAPSEAENSP